MIHYRKGTIADLPQTLGLVKELAEYENAIEQVETTVEQMEADGFGERPLFDFFVAETTDKLVGLGLYYFRYSTWKGKVLYLEDIIVTEQYRGKGIGKRMFNLMAQEAISTNCNQMMWQVLDWNGDAMKFYDTLGTKYDSEWVNCKLNRAQIAKLATTPPQVQS